MNKWHGTYHLALNLATILQNYQKLTDSLLPVFWLMWVLCNNSRRSSSVRFSWSCLAMALNYQKSRDPSPFLSKMANTLLIPSLVLVYPTLEATISKNSLKLMDLLQSLRPWMRPRMKGFLFSNPNYSRTLLISAGSMDPLLS